MTAARPAPAWAGAFLLAAAVALLAPGWLRGATVFWGDLTYIHHPWQAFSAQELQAGRVPLWDANLYLGMPAAATMQRALFYPLQSPFFIFGFASGLAVFHLVHFWLAGWLTYLFLRRLRLPGSACLGGALLYALAGGVVSRAAFINHLSTLSLLPALLLFFTGPRRALGAALACAFLAGYPPFLPGAAVMAWALSLGVCARRPAELARAAAAGWAAAGALALALSACQLLPGLELMALSRRAGGMDASETLRFGYSWTDLRQWVSPALVSGFDPAVEWWKASYLGFVGCAATVAGLLALAGRRRWAAVAALGAVLLLILGESFAPSLWLWRNLPPLKFIRYPGNVAYLAIPGAALLAAVGLARLPRPWRGGAALLLGLELLACAWSSPKLAPRSLFTTAGPLVRYLQDELRGNRYLLSPLALETHAGSGVVDWKTRLYGLTNAPFRIRAVGNFGEPLVPAGSYALMDWLYRRPSAEAAAAAMPWAGASYLLTPRPTAGGGLVPDGELLWHMARVKGTVSSAYWLDEASGAALPAGLPEGWAAPAPEAPLRVERTRDDRFAVRGSAPAPGWVYVAEPRYPGWRAWVGGRAVETAPALGAFQKVAVPAGDFVVSFRYQPWTWFLGLALTALAVVALGWSCYNPARYS